MYDLSLIPEDLQEDCAEVLDYLHELYPNMIFFVLEYVILDESEDFEIGGLKIGSRYKNNVN